MARPNRDLLLDFNIETNRNRESDSNIIKTPKKALPKKKPKKQEEDIDITPKQSKVLNIINKGELNSLSPTQLITYFTYLFEQENKMPYVVASKEIYNHHLGIFKSLSKHYSNADIKLMLDFLFLSNQDNYNKNLINCYTLKMDKATRILGLARLWIKGEYVPIQEYFKAKENRAKASEPVKRRREWASSKTKEKQEKISDIQLF